MNERMLSVNLIQVQDSFIHLSSKLIREFNVLANHKHPVCIKVTEIDSKGFEFFGSFSQTPYNSNGDDALNISHELSIAIGLKKSRNVLITVVHQVYPLERIRVSPVTSDDWDLLMLNNTALQDSILHQLQIVQKSQYFPIWVSKFIHLNIFIDDLGIDVKVGLLKESTEIVVIPNEKHLVFNPNAINNNVDANLDLTPQTDKMYINNFIPLTKYHNRFIFRTILVDGTLLKTDHIYDYCALISKSHMSILFNSEKYSSKNSFVKISLVHELDEESPSTSQNKNTSLVLRLCPLDPLMNNIEKLEVITWPTIYVTKLLSKMLDLKNNSKVVLEPVITINNEICNVQKIFISPLKKMKVSEEESLIECTKKRLKDEIDIREVLVLNNSTLLRVVHNLISTTNVLVTFSPSNIPYVFLNNYNFGILKFTTKIENKSSGNNLSSISNNEKIMELKIHNDLINIEEMLLPNSNQLEYYNLKCFKEMMKTGSLCLKLGLQCFNNSLQTFLAFDNLLITGEIGTGKTSAAKFFCQKFSKCPYFIKIIWINGRFLAGKLWETVQKQIIQKFQECLHYQPALVVIDDFDDLCHLNSEPNAYADMSQIYLRPLHLLMRLIENYTAKHYCTRVLCTAKPLNQENENLFTKQFKHVFKTVIHIPLINKEDKKTIISKRLSKIPFDKDVDNDCLMEICEKMDSYVFQDIIDYCDKVLFEIFKDGSYKVLNKTILTNVFESVVPLSLHSVNLIKEKKFNFSLVGGLKEAKQTITETIIWPSLHPDVFSTCPLKLQSGVLLYGAPGTGKTLLARAIVGESNLNFISINGPELLSKYIGESEESVRNVFQRAQNAKPCIIFFDEFESIAPKRGSEQTGVTDRVVNQFLTQLDGIDTLEGVWVIVATSRPDLIDQALLRPGRIGVKLHCPVPNKVEREDILRILCKNVTLCDDIDLCSIAVETKNYTGADLSGLLYTALSVAEKKLSKDEIDTLSSNCEKVREPKITTDDFRDAIKMTKPSLQQIDIDRYTQMHQIFSGKKITVNDKNEVIRKDSKKKKNQQKSTLA